MTKQEAIKLYEDVKDYLEYRIISILGYEHSMVRVKGMSKDVFLAQINRDGDRFYVKQTDGKIYLPVEE